MNVLSDVNRMLDNKNATTILTLILALYSGLAAPALPNQVIDFFDTFVGRILLIFLIGFTASKNIQVALMIAVAFVVSLHVVNQRSIEQYQSFKYLEQFANKDDAEDDGDNDNDNDNDNGNKWNCNSCTKVGGKDSPVELEGPDLPKGSGDSKNEFQNADLLNEEFIDFNDTSTATEAYIQDDEIAEEFRNYRIEGMEGAEHGSHLHEEEESFRNKVQPAHNLNGDSNSMYAPIQF
jgi:hypothetical protein